MAAEFEPERPELAGEATVVIVEGERDELEVGIEVNREKGEIIEGSIFRNGHAGMMGGESGRTCRLPAPETREPEG